MNNPNNSIGTQIGPKTTAAVAAGTTFVGQVQSAMAIFPDVGAMDIVYNALQSGNLSAILPAPIAAVIAYIARKSKYQEPLANTTGADAKTDDNQMLLEAEMDDRFERVWEAIDRLREDMNENETSNDHAYAELSRQVAQMQIPASEMGYTDKSILNTHGRRIGELETKLRHANSNFANIGSRLDELENSSEPVKIITDPQITGPVIGEEVEFTDKEHEQRAEGVDDKVMVLSNRDDQELLDDLRQLIKTLPKRNFRFSKRSEGNFDKVPDELVNIFREVLKETPFDFVVTRGFATREEQAALMRKQPRVTWTKNSRHLYGLALDIAIFDENGEITWKMPYYVIVGEIIQRIAQRHGVAVTIGAIHWNKDGPHTELKKSAYPDDGSKRIDDPFNL